MIQIIQATAGDQLAIAGDLFLNYAASLDFDLGVQRIRDTEGIKSTEIAPDFCSCSRRIRGRNLIGCNS